MRIGDIMSEQVETISLGASVGEAREVMTRNDIRHLVVMDGTRVAGVVSVRDLGRDVAGNHNTWIEHVMSSPVVTADRHTTLRQAANLLRGHKVGCLPVIEKGKPVGIVTISDLLDIVGKGVTRTKPGASHWEEKHRGRRRSRHVPTR
jgi:CBS domain-containing protein